VCRPAQVLLEAKSKVSLVSSDGVVLLLYLLPAAGIPLYPSDSSSSRGPPAGHLTLPVVSLSAADDQVLFELNVRLQYSDDERLLLLALLELAGAVGLDMPAEALLTRPSLLVSQ
jgi:hypothetical protein